MEYESVENGSNLNYKHDLDILDTGIFSRFATWLKGEGGRHFEDKNAGWCGYHETPKNVLVHTCELIAF